MRRDRLLPALCVVVAFGLAGCGSTALLNRTTSSSAGTVAARLPPVPQAGPRDHQALVYLTRALETVLRDNRACLPFGRTSHQAPDDGSPSQLMLSTFAVLKLRAKAAVPYGGFSLAGGAFVNYIRIAQRRFDWPFKVIPVKSVGIVSSHCLALEASAVHASVAHAPAKVRARALQIERERQRDGQYLLRHPEGICVSGYHGAAFCESFLFAQADGGVSGALSGHPDQVVFCLVPNGVARITVRYPGSPGRSVTVPVINNLAVWRLTDAPSEISRTSLGPTVLWRAANGRVIRTVSPSI